MSGEFFSRKIGRTVIHSELPANSPVVKGVFEAGEMLGGKFPEHVREIHIVGHSGQTEDGRRSKGRCYGGDPDGSTLVIFGGTFNKNDPESNRFQAKRTTLHEVGHSQVASEIHNGHPELRNKSGQYHEDRAEEYVNQVLHPKIDSPNIFWDDLTD